MADPLAEVLAAAFFAAEAHREQCRKDTDQSPYINHPLSVAYILAEVAGVQDVELLSAALLHDTVEDTEVTFEQLAERFGPEVRDLVAEVTDDETLPKARRKALQVEHAPHLSERAKLLKIADKISNLRDIGPKGPAGWSLERKRQYVEWGEQVVAGCRGINEALDDLFDQTVREVRARLVELGSAAQGPAAPGSAGSE